MVGWGLTNRTTGQLSRHGSTGGGVPVKSTVKVFLVKEVQNGVGRGCLGELPQPHCLTFPTLPVGAARLYRKHVLEGT